MKTRKKQPEQTRQAILSAAGKLFGTRGFAATGIGAIVEEAGLTKGALFHHFSDKRELAIAWIRDELKPRLDEGGLDPLESIDRLDAFSRFWIDCCKGLQDGDAWSALVAMSAELAGRDELLSKALAEVFGAWRSGIKTCLERGQRDGWIHGSIQAEAEAGILISMIAGFSVIQRVQPGRQGGEPLAVSLAAYIETLRPA